MSNYDDRFKTPTISGHSPQYWRYPLFVLPVVVIWLVSSWMAFDYGRGRAGFDSEAASLRISEMRSEIRIKEREREQLKRNIALLERKLQVYTESERVLKGSLISHQDEKLKLKKEILFLRGMLSQKAEKRELKLEDLTTTKSDGEKAFRLRFTLKQSLAGKKRVEGRMNITLNGKDDKGKAKSYTLGKIAANQFNNKIGFRHFQKVDESFRLPQGFKPLVWQIELKPSTRGYKVLKQKVEWNTKVE